MKNSRNYFNYVCIVIMKAEESAFYSYANCERIILSVIREASQATQFIVEQ